MIQYGLPDSITKPVSDAVVRGNRWNKMLKRKLSPAKRRSVMHRLRQSRLSLKVAGQRFIKWGIKT